VVSRTFSSLLTALLYSELLHAHLTTEHDLPHKTTKSHAIPDLQLDYIPRGASHDDMTKRQSAHDIVRNVSKEDNIIIGR